MHGRPRGAGLSQDPRAKAAEQRKTLQYANLQTQVLSNHREHRYTQEAMEASAKLLELNPDTYTVWNYRKCAIKHMIVSSTEEKPFSAKEIFAEELQVVERALRRNHKAYGAWYHRKWVVGLWLERGACPLQAELSLLAKLLAADPRNLHTWSYWRFVSERAGTSVEEDLRVTMAKIEENFSNYSAWHYRSVLLTKLWAGGGGGASASALDEEFDLVRSALFTEPDDQSGWMFYFWLLARTLPSLGVPLARPGGAAPSRETAAEDADSEERREPLLGVTGGGQPEPCLHDSMQAAGPPRGAEGCAQQPAGKEEGEEGASARPSEEAGCRPPAGQSESRSSGERPVGGGPEASGPDASELQRRGEAVLDREIDMCRELLQLEADSKWATLILAKLLAVKEAAMGASQSTASETRGLFERLMHVDPFREGFYSDMLRSHDSLANSLWPAFSLAQR